MHQEKEFTIKEGMKEKERKEKRRGNDRRENWSLENHGGVYKWWHLQWWVEIVPESAAVAVVENIHKKRDLSDHDHAKVGSWCLAKGGAKDSLEQI